MTKDQVTAAKPGPVVLTAEMAQNYLALFGFSDTHAEFLKAVEAIARGEARIAVRCYNCNGMGRVDSYGPNKGREKGREKCRVSDCKDGWRLA
jgi:hypothetical protein